MMGVWFQNDSKIVQIRRKINADLFETKLIKTAMGLTINSIGQSIPTGGLDVYPAVDHRERTVCACAC
jgi:hypothetical protein